MEDFVGGFHVGHTPVCAAADDHLIDRNVGGVGDGMGVLRQVRIRNRGNQLGEVDFMDSGVDGSLVGFVHLIRALAAAV